MKKLLTLLFSLLLIFNLTITIKAEELDTIILNSNTQNYTYLEHPVYNAGVKTIVVAEGVEYIGDFTFFRMSDLEEVILPSTIKEIGDYAFYECKNLKVINLENVETIGKYSFYGCEQLEVEFFGNKGAHALDFEGDLQLSYNMSLARFEAAVNYLNDIYLTTDLGFEIDYCSPADIRELQALADYITQGCTSETEKAHAIYDYVYNNISYGFAGYSAIDVFRTGQGVCAGQSQLLATLMKLSGMPTAIVRVLKENTAAKIDYLGINVNLDFTYNRSNKYHEFVITYANNEWKAYDCLYNLDGETDLTVLATSNWLIHVDGVYAYSDEGFDLLKNDEYADIYYYNGHWYNWDLNHNYLTGGASLGVGGCITYSKLMWYNGAQSYYQYLGSKTNVQGEAYAGGWYDLMNIGSLKYYVLDNGVQFRSGIRDYGNSTYLFYNGNSIEIDESFLDIGMTGGAVNMFIGEELTFSAQSMSIKSVSNNNVSVNGNTLKAESKGKSYVTFFIEGHVTALNRTGIEITVEFNIYGDIIESNDLFKTLCDHETSHEVLELIYCDYCGLIIEEEIEEPVEEVIESEEVEQEQVEEVIEEEQEVEEQEQQTEEQLEEVVEENTNENVEETQETEEPIETPEIVETPIIEEELIETPTIEEPGVVEQEIIEETPIEQEEVVEEPVIEEIVENETQEEVVDEEPQEEVIEPEELIEHEDIIEEDQHEEQLEEIAEESIEQEEMSEDYFAEDLIEDNCQEEDNNEEQVYTLTEDTMIEECPIKTVLYVVYIADDEPSRVEEVVENDSIIVLDYIETEEDIQEENMQTLDSNIYSASNLESTDLNLDSNESLLVIITAAIIKLIKSILKMFK